MTKRKRDILDGFDPNKSDSEDENFEPGEDAPRRSKKKTRASRSKLPASSKRRTRYSGSDIEDDDEALSDSGQEQSFSEGSDEEEDMEANATGRRVRKVAAKQQNYKESSEDESIIEDSDGGSDDLMAPPKKPGRGRPSKIIVLKTQPRNLRDRPSKEPLSATRRTRAHTEDAEEFVELTNSGRHAMPARSSRSKSPDTMMQSTRATRGSHGIKKPYPPIEEATQESSSHGTGGKADANLKEDDGDDDGEANRQADEPAENEPGEEDEYAQAVEVEDSMKDNAEGGEEMQVDDDDAAEEDDEDVQPVNRRTRSARAAASVPAVDEADDENENNAASRRLTRKSRLRQKKKKSLQEPSSDFDPGDEDSGEGEGFGSESSQKDNGADSNGDDSSQRSRGRRAAHGKSAAKKRRGHESEEDDVDRDEVAMEAEELRASSHSRPRRRRSPDIVYEQQLSKRRRTAPVDYSIKPLDQLVEHEEDEDPAPTPARRRNARNGGGGGAWQRNLLSTFGPFGGGGGVGSLIGGPWGTGAAGGVESDSSDDEMVHRSGVGGNVGMTPTSAAVPGFAAPLNLEAITGVSATPNVGKLKNQKAFADADPLGVDTTVDFSKVGGLQGHINQLKEMVTLPLLYPELFLRFKVTPPRGVLFHGPPGTGKTLLARALANSVGIGGRKITFYMRKGADALSKWVGEAEKQLRLLFEEARRTQPSIIFFDEIDGLAPVRSSKQEQIHASIVSTLLALMDGMDGRGQVIVIGATNRPDNIDPALRRPGRFDREFYFPLPDLDGRKSIIDIHTKDWGISDDFKKTLAENTKGYGGADMRALCTEAALNAIQRTYPQIYSSSDKLIVDPGKIDIHAADFMISMKRMIPSSERSASSAAALLPKSVEPLLRSQLASMVRLLDEILPRKKKITALEEAMFEPHEDEDQGFGRENMNQQFERSRIFRPRLLITGPPGMGHTYLSSAILQHFEGVHIQNFDLPSILGDGRPLEQVIVGLFVEVKRHKPAVIFVPSIDIWPSTMPESAYTTFTTMLRSIPASDPVLLLGTAECDFDQVPPGIMKTFFGFSKRNHIAIGRPNKESRLEFFSSVTAHISRSPADFPDPSSRKKRVLEDLPVAPPPPPKPKTKADIKEELRKDHLLLNLLKVQLQPIMDQIKKYKKFRQPVIADTQVQYLWHEADPSYVRPDLAPDLVGLQLRPYEIAKDKDGLDGLRETATGKFYYNLDLATIEERLSNGYYARPRDFYRDVCSLAKDAKNIGDKERVLKANELVTNVEVDVAEAEARLSQANWDELHQRQLQRAKDAAERARKRKAAQLIVDLIQSDVHDSDSQDRLGPVRIGESIPGTTSARFRLMSPSPLSNGHAAAANQLSNGTSGQHQNEEDVQMGGVDGDVTQPHSQMGPPAQWPRPELRSLDLSTRATAGNTQISQRSVLTAVPPGMSPSAILNDASTTKTSDPSTHRGSRDWSTQATNGVHTEHPDNSQMPDTQPIDSGPSQGTSSNEPWPHSQAQGLARGIIQQPMGFDARSRSEETSPTSSQVPPGSKSSRSGIASMANLLNDDNQSIRNSGSSSSSSQPQPIVPPESHVRSLLDTMAERTSGCTIEQLEQLNRELVDTVWRTRHENNRTRVLAHVSKAFNDTIAEIDSMQGFQQMSQEQGDR